MTEQTDIKAVYAALNQRCAKRGGAAERAARVGVSPAYVSQMMNGEKKISMSVMLELGFRKVTIFERIA